MTELCFQRCVADLNYRALTRDEVGPGGGRGSGRGEGGRRGPGASEPLPSRPMSPPQEACLDGCAGKLVRSNHRLMAAYVQLMPSLVQRRIADYEAAGRDPAALPGPDAS